MIERLERADAALGEGDREAAIGELIIAWRESRIPAVADLVDELAAIAPSLELGQKIPPKLEAFGPWLRNLSTTDDPRAATLLHRLLRNPPIATKPGWEAMFAIVTLLRDPRSLAVLVELRDTLEGMVPPSQLAGIQRERGKVHKRLLQRYVQLPALPPETAPIVATLRTKIAKLRVATVVGARPGEALLAAIRAAPDDDRPRLVYADWLQERGDPQGEFIALQLSARDARTASREATMIRQHGTAWLGRLAEIAILKGTRFARGFPVSLTVRTREAPRLAAVVGALTWWSIEELAFIAASDGPPEYATLVCDPALAALRTVRGLSVDHVHQLARTSPPLAVTTLGVLITGSSALGGSRPGLPALRHLELQPASYSSAVPLVHRLLGDPFANGLESIRFPISSARCTVSGRQLQLERTEALTPRMYVVVVDELRTLLTDGAFTSVEIVVGQTARARIETLLVPVIAAFPHLALTVRS